LQEGNIQQGSSGEARGPRQGGQEERLEGRREQGCGGKGGNAAQEGEETFLVPLGLGKEPLEGSKETRRRSRLEEGCAEGRGPFPILRGERRVAQGLPTPERRRGGIGAASTCLQEEGESAEYGHWPVFSPQRLHCTEEALQEETPRQSRPSPHQGLKAHEERLRPRSQLALQAFPEPIEPTASLVLAVGKRKGERTVASQQSKEKSAPRRFDRWRRGGERQEELADCQRRSCNSSIRLKAVREERRRGEDKVIQGEPRRVEGKDERRRHWRERTRPGEEKMKEGESCVGLGPPER
jgi:hypothetical protein